MQHLATLRSAALAGLDALPVEVEVDIGAGLPALTVVGLPGKAVEESKERVRSAIRNSKVSLPNKRITINLAPADIKKEGPAYDLPIALGVLAADGQVPATLFARAVIVGELALDGKVRPVSGVLSTVMAARRWGAQAVYVPSANRHEALLVRGIDVYPVESLRQMVEAAHGQALKQPASREKVDLAPEGRADFDMAEIKGQENAKRALIIAAAGHHNILLNGPPGSGKTMLARALSGILPPLVLEEALEITRIYSVSGLLAASGLVKERPFRSPHHTTSNIALVGGGTVPKPGEISLAHRGVLFLDEFPEFPRSVLEALRQPLEDRKVTVSRAQGSLTFPADFILVASQNPCPCGFLGDPDKECSCSAYQVQKYLKRVSGPLLDRIDLHIEVPRQKYQKMVAEDAKGREESSVKIRKKITVARVRQAKRLGLGRANSQMTNTEIKKFCRLDKAGHDLLRQAVDSMHLSGRGFVRILKVARTIADLEGCSKVSMSHLAEAIQYRPKERGLS